VSDAEGTQMLARALRSAHNKTRGSQHAQDEIMAAIAGIRVSKASKIDDQGGS